MDNVCHTLVGIALAKAGLERKSGLALPVLAVAANLPDVDVIAVLTGDGLAFRRGWTHGVLALAVLPVVLVALVALWARYSRSTRLRDQPRWSWLWVMATLGVATHLLLDWMNSYGVRLLMPFSDRWYYGDALFIVDPWVLAILGAGVLLAGRRRNRRPARWALLLVTLYAGASVWLTLAARSAVARTMTSGGIAVDTMVVDPVPLDPLARRVILARNGAYWFARARWPRWGELEPSAEPLPIAADAPWARAAAATTAGRQFLKWARLPFFQLGGERGTVYIADARYVRRGERSWASILVRIDSLVHQDSVQTAEVVSNVCASCVASGDVGLAGGDRGAGRR